MFSVFTFVIIQVIGFMMATIYKRSVSNINTFQINPNYVYRTFWIAAIVGIVLCSYLSFRAISSFHDAGLAEDKLHVFEDNEQMLTFFLNLGLVLMIFMANLCSLTSKKVLWRFYIATFIVYSLFAIIDNFFLGDALFQFKKINQLWSGEFNLSELNGYLMLFFTAIGCGFNAIIIRWGLKK